MSNINSSIFKAYDIRGVYPDEINEDAAYKIGQAFVKFLENEGRVGNRQIVVGRDARESSQDLFDALTQGLLSQGADIIDIGEVSTPLFYWAIINQSAAGGIMITASHNPAQFNGFKICASQARSIGLENGLSKIRDLAAGSDFTVGAVVGKATEKNSLSGYIDFVLENFAVKELAPTKVVIDCGNGMAGPEILEIIKKLPWQTEVLYAEPDGRFPNHEANPIKEETLAVLKEKVLSGKADLGVAFDGDGDRVAFLDEKGGLVRGDFITALIAREILKKEPGQKIFYEVRTSKIVPEIVKANGGVPVLGRPGHAPIKEQMRKEDILFGGELSGHYFYKKFGFIENTLFTMLEMARVIYIEQKSLSEIIAPLKKYFVSGEINFKVGEPDKILADIEQKYSGAEIKKIGGLTVIYPDWWFNLRKSNTEPLVRLNMEADSAELLEEKKREVVDLIK
ncbi:MAG: phosphomannomutase/phosphoglucomutase [Candidatus Portnoybacteria bacterium]|nr:phosphomannomutase/phosphoglucomutase [Candidatus Portnoybacteria bacterium]MDD4983192.1 phosphomannomutase/phosphoglucomutase [Candidatus Portnoybacteria bacterium]